MVLIIYLIIILSLSLAVLLIDIIPILRDWLNRIHIGRYDSSETWKESITKQGILWLNNTPKIKVTDNTRLVVIDIVKGNYSKPAIQYWQEASLLLGLEGNLDRNQLKDEIQFSIKKYLSSTFDENGQWNNKPKHIDGAILAYAIMKLSFIDTDKYKKAFDYMWEHIKEHIGGDGTVGYRKSMGNYRYVDTIGFICPFLIAYGIKYNKEECVELAVRQIKDYERFGMLDSHAIPCHAYKVDNKIPLGLYGWGRGLGWYAIGLMDAWLELPKEHKYKSTLEESVRNFAESAMKFQQGNGSWNWTVTRTECRSDSSATATLGWFMRKASELEDISIECKESTEKAIKYLMSVTRRSGAVDFSQGDTKDIGVYSMLFNILPFTQGFCIRMMHTYNTIDFVD